MLVKDSIPRKKFEIPVTKKSRIQCYEKRYLSDKLTTQIMSRKNEENICGAKIILISSTESIEEKKVKRITMKAL